MRREGGAGIVLELGCWIKTSLLALAEAVGGIIL